MEKYLDNRMWDDVSRIPEGLGTCGGDVCSIDQNIFLMGVKATDEQKYPLGLKTVHRLDVRRGITLLCLFLICYGIFPFEICPLL